MKLIFALAISCVFTLHSLNACASYRKNTSLARELKTNYQIAFGDRSNGSIAQTYITFSTVNSSGSFTFSLSDTKNSTDYYYTNGIGKLSSENISFTFPVTFLRFGIPEFICLNCKSKLDKKTGNFYGMCLGITPDFKNHEIDVSAEPQ